MVRSRSLLILLATLASAVVAAEMADYNRGLDAIVTKVQANGDASAPVNADTLVPEDSDPEVADESPSKLAAREVTTMLQQGKDEGECRKLADALCDEVSQNVKTFDKQIKDLPKGKKCKNKGMTLVKQTKQSLKESKREYEKKVGKVKQLEQKIVTWKYSLGDALDQEPKCDQFWSDANYLKKKAAHQQATDDVSEAKSKVDTLTIQLDQHTRTAATKKRACECQVRAAYNELYRIATLDQAKDAKAYAKCQHMKCFLNHPKKMSKCQNLQIKTPEVKEFNKFAAGVPAKECKDEAKIKADEPCPLGLLGLVRCGEGQEPIETPIEGRKGLKGEQCFISSCRSTKPTDEFGSGFDEGYDSKNLEDESSEEE